MPLHNPSSGVQTNQVNTFSVDQSFGANVEITGNLSVTGTTPVKKLTSNTTQAGNVGTGEDNLITYSVPAATLGNNGEYLHFAMFGQFAASLNNKRLRAYFGSTLIFDTGVLAITTNTDWSLEGEIIRVDATNQRATVRFASSNAALLASSKFSAPTETLSGAITLKATGEATSNDDVVQKALMVEKYT